MSEESIYVSPGELKLLDWFAGVALMGLLSERGAINRERTVELAFAIARQMVDARSHHVPREEASTQ